MVRSYILGPFSGEGCGKHVWTGRALLSKQQNFLWVDGDSPSPWDTQVLIQHLKKIFTLTCMVECLRTQALEPDGLTSRASCCPSLRCDCD